LIQAKAKQEELTGWTDDTKGLRIVIISGLFNLDSFSERLSERLRDLLETRIGEVERVKIFRFNPMGVAEVKFKKHSNAEKCIKEFNEKEILEKIVRCEYWDGRTDYRRVSAV
jgi:HIV Tat-specific factor 1